MGFRSWFLDMQSLVLTLYAKRVVGYNWMTG